MWLVSDRESRVLDVGSGAGDVALIVGEPVPPGGNVVGIDRDGASVHAASAPTRAIGAQNVALARADLDVYVAEAPFDVLVGRLVLMYSPDPPASIRHLADRFARAVSSPSWRGQEATTWR